MPPACCDVRLVLIGDTRVVRLLAAVIASPGLRYHGDTTPSDSPLDSVAT